MPSHPRAPMDPSTCRRRRPLRKNAKAAFASTVPVGAPTIDTVNQTRKLHPGPRGRVLQFECLIACDGSRRGRAGQKLMVKPASPSIFDLRELRGLFFWFYSGTTLDVPRSLKCTESDGDVLILPRSTASKCIAK